MDIRVLRYFLAVASEESISGAANFLNITQPTLSRQLMELEEELGTKLFIRSNRKITLTEDGMLLRKRAGDIVYLADRTVAELQASDEVISGEICIGCGETHAMSLVAQVIKKLQSTHPEIQFNLYSANADDVSECLDRGMLDFGVLIESADVKKYDFIRLPYTDVWGIIMRKDSPLAGKKRIKPEDLATAPLICSNQTMVSNQISGWMKKDFDKLNIVATYNLVYNASLLVEAGVGYALSLDKLVNNKQLCFIPLEPRLEARLDLVWKRHQIFSKPAAVFLKALREELVNTV